MKRKGEPHFDSSNFPACGVDADVRLTRDKRKVKCGNCVRTKAFQRSKGKDSR